MTQVEMVEPHRLIGHTIENKPGYQLPYRWIYNLSEVELRTLKANINTNLANGFIQLLSSETAALILFTKKNGRLNLFIGDRALNKGNVNNSYSPALISEMLNRLHGACVFKTLDYPNAK